MNKSKTSCNTIGSSALKSESTHIIEFPVASYGAHLAAPSNASLTFTERFLYNPIVSQLRWGSIQGYSSHKAKPLQVFLAGSSFFAFAVAAILFGS